jgi:high-affinity iron transporter
MLGTGIIVFRETLEAALFIGIVAASTTGLDKRTRWLSLGVAMGMLGSLLMASAMDSISNWAEGFGTDLVTACILVIALAMLAWHCIWVSAHAKDMVKQARSLGSDAIAGNSTLWALSIAVGLSVLREGAETVLFVAGLVSGSEESAFTVSISVLAGLASGALAGFLVYTGLGKVKPQRLFAVTNVLILLLAGNLASHLAKTLNQADVLPYLSDSAWDISSLLPNESAPGMLLHGVIGYDANPMQLQLVFYVATVALIYLATRLVQQSISVAPVKPA